ncbi:MAG: HPP family protein [Acidiferrobacterales bacterium]
MRRFLKKMSGGEVCPPRKPLSKIAWSWLGAFIGIYLVSVMSRITDANLLDSLFLVGSFGASAVLIYGAPQVEYAQPRNLIGGHIISAAIGVTMYKFLALDIALMGALAVSLSIVAMHFTRTIHPPGGATALIAVIGSHEVHNTGYLFVVTPIASGVFIMLIVALVVNNLSSNPKRHYPRFWL